MAESIIVKYEADISSIKAQLLELKKNQEVIVQQQKQFGKEASAAAKSIGKETDILGNQFAKLGGIIAAAFSIGAIISFGRASIDAFAKAEKASLQLLNALNGNVEAHRRLTKQAKELQANIGIDDDTIVQQQAFLAVQNRTESQIKKIIQAAVQYSAVMNVDLATAVRELDKTFEGTIGRLAQKDKAFRDLSATQLANGAAIDLVNEKYKGFAEAGAAGVSGQLEIQRRRVEELQEALGEKLAPMLLSIKEKFLQAFSPLKVVQETLAKLDKIQDEIDAKREAKTIPLLEEELQAYKNKRSVLLKDAEANAEALNTNAKLTEDLRLYIERRKAASKVTVDAANTELETLENLQKKKDELEKQQLKVTAGPQANELIKQIAEVQAKIDEITGKAQEERRKKAEEEEKKLAEAKRKGFEAARQEYEDIEKKKLDIQLKGFEVAREEYEDIEKKKQDLQRKSFEVAREEYEKLQDDEVKKKQESEDAKQEAIQATFDFAQNLLGQLQGLFSAQDAAEIDAINARKDAQLEAIDEELEKLDEAHEKRKIGDKQYEAAKKKLLDKRKADEEAAAKKTKEIQRQQAERDKAIAIFQIILNTAAAIVKALPNVFLAALAGATGAAQLAIAVATPIPQFKKGTKGKKGAGVGLVGEEGAELVYMPSGTQVVPADRTKRYKDAVNAMIDGQFEQYVYKSMIAPALREATKKMEEKRNKSFAENVANIFNTSQEGTNPYRVYDGVRMNNKELADAIARAMAKHLTNNSNDRYYH